jgi:beta-xylosidase
MNKILIITTISILIPCFAFTQKLKNGYWIADNGDGTYSNPILHTDYSDPDVIRVGDNFYMTASSFNCIPGLPILQSRDLVNWELIGYALPEMYTDDQTKIPQHGNFVWAPAIRFHNNEYYIYWGDPDHGIYVIKAPTPQGPWTKPHLVQEAKGWIDPCPLWDDNGKAYLVHAFAGSRAGIKSVLVINEMSSDGLSLSKTCHLVFDGNERHSTVEGPKMYKRNGYYYILAPAGGVKTGWQLALRSKNIFGPYEEKVVLQQGNTAINGPHQGGLVELESGESWFVHFQDKYEYGRIVHLQPVKWENNWPIMGYDNNNDGIGEPVTSHKKPNIKSETNKKAFSPIPVSDEFNEPEIGLQWQWQSTPKPEWCFPTTYGFLRMNCMMIENEPLNMWDIPNLLLQKFPAEQFSATTRFELHPKLEGDRAGLVVMGEDYCYLAVEYWGEKRYITFNSCANARKEQEVQSEKQEITTPVIYMKVDVKSGGMCQFSYSEDGTKFKSIGKAFKARAGMWIGAKVGIFALKKTLTNDSGYANFDWFRVE